MEVWQLQSGLNLNSTLPFRSSTWRANHSSLSLHTCTRYSYHFLIPSTLQSRNAFSLFFNSRSFSVLNTNQHHQSDNNLTLSNLVNSCGLSPEIALKLSIRLKLATNPNAPNDVVQLLINHGFSDSQLRSYVKKRPLILLSDAEKTLLPKLKFLQSIGVSTTDLPEFLIGNPSFLSKSLEKHIIPRYEVIRSLVCSDKEVVSALRHDSWTLNHTVLNDAVLNIEVLRKLNVPQACISLLVSNFPCVALTKHSVFVATVNSVKEMGFDPLKSNFVLALQVLVKMKKGVWESRFKIFERWGWSRDMCLSAFLKHPQYVMISEEKVIKGMNFLVNDVGVSPEEIARRPGMLNRNLEKTIIPRWTVVKVLKSRGLVKSDLRISTVISISEKKFLERYVTRYQKDVPLLLDAYNGQMIDHLGIL